MSFPFGCGDVALLRVQLRQMQGNYSGMLAELDIAKEIDPTHCDLSFQYGTYYAAVRSLRL